MVYGNITVNDSMMLLLVNVNGIMRIVVPCYYISCQWYIYIYTPLFNVNGIIIVSKNWLININHVTIMMSMASWYQLAIVIKCDQFHNEVNSIMISTS